MIEKQSTNMTLYSAALFVLFFSIAHGDECQPEFADTCFSAVEDDIKFMLHLKKSGQFNITKDSVHELCLALDDSLSCTSDIIDTDCEEADGRDKFDSWLVALRAAYNYVCEGANVQLLGILEGISCWSIEDFYLCSMEKANLKHINDLLHTKIDDSECNKLRSVVSACFRESSTGSCREREDISLQVGNMIQAFFTASNCNQEEAPVTHTSSSQHMFASSWFVSLSLAAVLLLVPSP